MSKAVVKTLQELVQTFFCQRLQNQQRVSGHTVASYRDTFRLAFEFIQKQTGRSLSQQSLADLESPTILSFLDYLEKERGCEPRTRNARLAAIRAFMRYVSQQEPTALALSSRVLATRLRNVGHSAAGHPMGTHRHRPVEGQRPKTAGSAFAQTNCYRFEAVLRRTVGRTDYAHLHEPLWPSTESLWCRNASPLGNENGRETMPFPERKEGFAAHVQAHDCNASASSWDRHHSYRPDART